MKITWYGTASVGMEDEDTKILFDPFVRQNRKLKTTAVEDYCGADAIFITHGHFDHIYDIPAITKADKKVPVYCTKTPMETFVNKKGVDRSRINVIAPGEVYNIGKFKITVKKGRHVTFDVPYIMSVVPKCTVQFPLFFKQVYYFLDMPQGDEIVAYEIEYDGKRILLTGSFDIPENEHYTEKPDLFILAHGGSTSVPKIATPFIEELKPKKIMITHYDNAFPPVTRKINVIKCVEEFQKNHTGFEFIVPKEGKQYIF